jgi:hypothetical protein
MSCESNATKSAQAAAKSGISKTAGKSSFVAGSTTKVSVFRSEKTKGKEKLEPGLQKEGNKKRARVSKKKTIAKKGKNAQPSFFKAAKKSAAAAADSNSKPLPTQWQVNVVGDFTQDELQAISVQLRFGAAAATRHVQMLGTGTSRGITHRDPRPLDWTRSDLEQYQFLINQLTGARRGRGYLDLSSLSKRQLVELWEFARFEQERANRNIDHLTTPLGPIQGPSAEYLIEKHKLEVRFFNHIAAHMERLVPAEELDAAIGQVY